MRIALIDPSEFSPPYDAALARGLAAIGHSATLIGAAGGRLALEPALDHRGHFYRPLATRLGRHLEGKAVRLAKGALHAFDLWRLPPLLRAMEVDVIHLQWAPLPIMDLALLQRLRQVAPMVFTVHDTVPLNGAEPWLMAKGAGRLTKAVDAVICHTEQGRSRLLRQGVPADRLHLVPHGLLGDRVDHEPTPTSRIRLLQFGQIKPYKGVDVLIEALALLDAGERASLDVQVVGKPSFDPRSLEALAGTRGVTDAVTFRFGFIDDDAMAGLLRDADAMLFPYREIEASGVLMQAIAHGHPVIASRIGVFAELLENRKHGLLVPPGNPAALAGALRRLLAKPASLTAMRQEMRCLRERIPDWPEIAGRTVEVYQRALRAISPAASSVPRQHRPT